MFGGTATMSNGLLQRRLKGGRAVTGLTLAFLVAATADPAIAQSRQNGDDATEPPTFADVLANPEDTALVFRYARHKIDKGDLPAAASALDQILVQQPDLHSVRLVYGVVLYRLGDLQGAKAELQRLNADALPSELDAKRRRYLEKIARDQQPLTGDLTLSAGISYETNASASPESGEVVVFDIPLDARGEEDDIAYSGGAQLRVEHKLDTGLPTTLFGEATGYAREYVQVDSQDLRFGSLTAGARVRTLWLDVIPSVSVGGLTLSSERFYRFAGPEVRLEHPLKGNATLFAEGRWYAESFDPIFESQSADDRSGSRFEARAGLKAVPVPELLLKSYGQVTDKRAREDFEAYTGARLVGEGTYRVFDDHFVQLRGNVGIRSYDGNDPFISGRRREDIFYRVQLSYGLPVPGGDKLAEELEDVMIVPSVGYYRQNSNIRNYEYENITTSVMLTKKFEF